MELDAFLDPLAAVLHVDAESVELVADEAAADAEIEAALRELVERRGLFRHPDRIVERQHRGAGAEPDALGARRQIGQEGVIGGKQPAMAHEMMLDDPDIVDADPVGEFDLLDDVVDNASRVAQRRADRSEDRTTRISSPRPFRFAKQPLASKRQKIILVSDRERGVAMTDYWLSKLFFDLQHDPQLAAEYRANMAA